MSEEMCNLGLNEVSEGGQLIERHDSHNRAAIKGNKTHERTREYIQNS